MNLSDFSLPALLKNPADIQVGVPVFSAQEHRHTQKSYIDPALFPPSSPSKREPVSTGACGVGFGCSGGGGQCGAGFGCSGWGGGGMCGVGFGCSGGDGECGIGFGCSGWGGDGVCGVGLGCSGGGGECGLGFLCSGW